MRAVEHDVLGTLVMPACPIGMSESDTGSTRPPPALGVHGPEVLRELGYEAGAIKALLDAGVLVTRDRLLAHGASAED
jgi:crotonobetainyl-CoA:carnitine CoA-transferase CaiB-like acyl-CoA transferase